METSKTKAPWEDVAPWSWLIVQVAFISAARNVNILTIAGAVLPTGGRGKRKLVAR